MNLAVCNPPDRTNKGIFSTRKISMDSQASQPLLQRSSKTPSMK